MYVSILAIQVSLNDLKMVVRKQDFVICLVEHECVKPVVGLHPNNRRCIVNARTWMSESCGQANTWRLASIESANHQLIELISDSTV